MKKTRGLKRHLGAFIRPYGPYKGLKNPYKGLKSFYKALKGLIRLLRGS